MSNKEKRENNRKRISDMDKSHNTEDGDSICNNSEKKSPDETMRISKDVQKSDTMKIDTGSVKFGYNTDKIQNPGELGNPDNFELDLEVAHKKDKEKEAEIRDMDRDIQNGDEIDEDSDKSNFIVGEIGDDVDIDILPMILKRNSQIQKKYDIEDLKEIKINIKKSK